jgi:hypothetical protein
LNIRTLLFATAASLGTQSNRNALQVDGRVDKPGEVLPHLADGLIQIEQAEPRVISRCTPASLNTIT